MLTKWEAHPKMDFMNFMQASSRILPYKILSYSTKSFKTNQIQKSSIKTIRSYLVVQSLPIEINAYTALKS